MNDDDSQNVSLFLLNALKKEGIDHVFLVPGAMIQPFVLNFSKASINPIVAAKEDGAAFMADGFGRASQKFGVCMGIGGPGITNMITPISAAYSDRSRVLVIAGRISFCFEARGTFQDSSVTGIDDISIMRNMTSFSAIVPAVSDTASFLKKAIKSMYGVENLPAFLSVPLDLQKKSTQKLFDSYSSTNGIRVHRVIDTNSVCHIPKILSESTRIVIYVGNGSVHSNAENEIKEFATKYNIPVVTTLRAKGAISEDDDASLGVFGMGGNLWANNVIFGSEEFQIPKAEIILVLGATINENNTNGWHPDFFPKKELIRIDINPNNITGTEYNERFVMGDVKTFLSWLKDNSQQYDEKLTATKDARRIWVESIKQTPNYVDPNYMDPNYADPKIPKPDEPIIPPGQVIIKLRNVAPKDSVLVVDSGSHTFFTSHYWKSFAPNEFLLLSSTGPMGYGISMGIGAKLARPQQPCICVVGDGSMLMGGMELVTAVRYNIPIVIVVMNNKKLANVYLSIRNEHEPKAEELSEINDINWECFAKSLGADGITVYSPDDLESSYQKAFKSKKPFVIDVKCKADTPTPNTLGKLEGVCY